MTGSPFCPPHLPKRSRTRPVGADAEGRRIHQADPAPQVEDMVKKQAEVIERYKESVGLARAGAMSIDAKSQRLSGAKSFRWSQSSCFFSSRSSHSPVNTPFDARLFPLVIGTAGILLTLAIAFEQVRPPPRRRWRRRRTRTMLPARPIGRAMRPRSFPRRCSACCSGCSDSSSPRSPRCCSCPPSWDTRTAGGL